MSQADNDDGDDNDSIADATKPASSPWQGQGAKAGWLGLNRRRYGLDVALRVQCGRQDGQLATCSSNSRRGKRQAARSKQHASWSHLKLPAGVHGDMDGYE